MIAQHSLSGFDQQTHRIRFGGYEVINLIANAANRERYAAQHIQSGDDVLLTLVEAAVNFPDRVARFTRNMGRVEMAHHPYIARFHGCDVVEGRPMLAVSHNAQMSLQQVIAGTKRLDKKERGLSAARALKLAQHIAMAVQFTHDHGFLVSNLTPETVLVNADGTPVLTEVGLADTLLDVGVPAAIATAGRAGYLSPERIKRRALDASDDVYALGALLHEMLLGRAPAAADGTGAQLVAPGLLPDALTRIVNTALADSPADRYATPFDFERAVAAIGQTDGHAHFFASLKRSALIGGLLLALSGGIVAAQVSPASLGTLGAPLAAPLNSARESITALATRVAGQIAQVSAAPEQSPPSRPDPQAPANSKPLTAAPTAEPLPTALPAEDYAMPEIVDAGVAEVVIALPEPTTVAPAASTDDLPAVVAPQTTLNRAVDAPAVLPTPATPEPAAAPAVAPTAMPARPVQKRPRVRTAPKPVVRRATTPARQPVAQTASTQGVEIRVLRTGADRWGRPAEWASGNRNICAFIDSPNDSGGERLWRFYAQIVVRNTSGEPLKLSPDAFSMIGRNSQRIAACMPGALTLEPGAERTVWVRTFFEGTQPAPYRIAVRNNIRAACVQPITGATNFAAQELVFRTVACR
jgi:eukaryotic-like serine/threonine-protein kinase